MLDFQATAFRPDKIAEGFIQASNVKVVRLSEAMLGTTTSPVPSKLNPWPTSPVPKLAPPESVPLLRLTESRALFSARHQLTKPEGADAQLARALCVQKEKLIASAANAAAEPGSWASCGERPLVSFKETPTAQCFLMSPSRGGRLILVEMARLAICF